MRPAGHYSASSSSTCAIRGTAHAAVSKPGKGSRPDALCEQGYILPYHSSSGSSGSSSGAWRQQQQQRRPLQLPKYHEQLLDAVGMPAAQKEILAELDSVVKQVRFRGVG
jgi:hypothetical protein